MMRPRRKRMPHVVPRSRRFVHLSPRTNTRSIYCLRALPPSVARGGREPAAMSYRGKVEEQERARALRAEGHTLADIAQKLGVSKSSVSLWVRDVPFTPSPRRLGPHRRPHPAHEAKLRQIDELNQKGVERIGVLNEAAFLTAGVAFYAGEGTKGGHEVRFANTDPEIVRFFCVWLRHFFDIDES